jgi:uncharacterized lipoprotein YddW (UPF0748 family)
MPLERPCNVQRVACSVQCKDNDSSHARRLARALTLNDARCTLHVACCTAIVSSWLTLPTAAHAQTVTSKGIASAVVRQAGLEGRVLWMDGPANLDTLSTRAGVARVLDKCRRANINTVVIDVKPLSGLVLYNSKIAPRMKEWRGKPWPADYDLLQTVIEEGRRRNLKVHAAINVFSEGHKHFKVGPAYSRPAWQAMVYETERTLIAPDGDRRALGLVRNRAPVDGEIALVDSGQGGPRPAAPEEVIAVFTGDRVAALLDGAVVGAEGVPVPAGGYLLVGRGDGASWLMEHLRVGDQVSYEAQDRLLPIADASSEPVAIFLNPANPEVRAYELSLVNEIVANYDVDGITFDRMRYASLATDFSDLSRRQFEAWLGKSLDRFPADVFQWDPSPARPPIPGRYYREWLEWRARNIRDWLREATAIVRYRRPNARCGAYVGSWYRGYYGVGVNWGAEDYAPAPLYDWMTPSYPAAGYAGLLDYLTPGCYHKIATRDDARALALDEGATVQAAAEQSVEVVNNSAFVYAGLYLLDYRDRPDDFRKALRAARESSQGVMLFDLVYLEQYDWWNHLFELFAEPRQAPHDVTDLLAAVRQAHRALAGSATQGKMSAAGD